MDCKYDVHTFLCSHSGKSKKGGTLVRSHFRSSSRQLEGDLQCGVEWYVLEGNKGLYGCNGKIE